MPCGGLWLWVGMSTLVNDLGDLSIGGPLHLLLSRTTRVGALVIAPWVMASFDLFLTVLSPMASIIELPLFFEGQRRLTGSIVIGLAMVGSQLGLKSWNVEGTCLDRSYSFDFDVVVAGLVMIIAPYVGFEGVFLNQT